jgi:hypothetical protein
MATSSDQPKTPSIAPTSERAEEVKSLTGKLTENLHELELDEATSEELRGHIETVEAQLSSEEPDHSIVDDALEAMHRLLESSTAQRAGELLAEVGRFLTGVG